MPNRPVVDLEHYVPAYLTWITNKLSRGASQYYLSVFDVGVETWRVLVLLAIEPAISAQYVSRVIGMDKASVSRTFKQMHSKGLITIGLDASDGRLRIARITPKGRELHNQILGMALAREQAFLSVLREGEAQILIDLLQRLHENLPEVDRATQRYIDQHFPEARRLRRVRQSPADSELDRVAPDGD